MNSDFTPKIVKIDHLKQYVLKKPNAKKDLLFIHPFTGRFNNKLQTFKKLLDYNVYGIEVAGHGDSLNFSPHEINWFEYINQVFSFIKQEKLDRFTILSHSMGGGISFIIAYFLKQRVEQIITETPISPALYFVQESLKYLIPQTEEEQIILLEKLVYNPKKTYGENYKNLAHIYLKDSLANNHLQKLIDFREMKLVYNFLSEIMSKIETKTTIILGEKDGIIGTDETLKYFKNLNNSLIEIIFVEKTGHLISVENLPIYEDIVLRRL